MAENAQINGEKCTACVVLYQSCRHRRTSAFGQPAQGMQNIASFVSTSQANSSSQTVVNVVVL
jgi:hypothetical protein